MELNQLCHCSKMELKTTQPCTPDCVNLDRNSCRPVASGEPGHAPCSQRPLSPASVCISFDTGAEVVHLSVTSG